MKNERDVIIKVLMFISSIVMEYFFFEGIVMEYL